MKRARPVLLALVGLFYVTIQPGLRAAPGELDPAFSTNGLVRVSFGAGSGGAHDVLVDPNGRILVAGTAFSGDDSSFAITRYLPDGSLDTSFGDSGVVITNVAVRPPT